MRPSFCLAIITLTSTNQTVDGAWIQHNLVRLQTQLQENILHLPVTTGTYYGSDHAFVKKYVIGSPADNGGLGGQQNINLNTYIMRLSEVYLIYADAILGNNASTSDPEALKYYNAVRIRAGIAPKTSITYADIFQEKKIEFAFEGHAWYDWKQWYYFNPSAALNYFNTQNRGLYSITYYNGISLCYFL